MTAISAVIDRTYRDYLTPPGEQPTRFKVGTGGIDNSSTTLPVDVAMLQAEEQDAIAVGVLIELGSELVLAETVTGDPPTSLTVRREMYSTSKVAHAAGDFAYLAGEDYKSRASVFDAIADSIVSLWPTLYSIEVEETAVSAGVIELPSTAGDVLDVKYSKNGRWLSLNSWEELHNFPHTSSGRGLQVPVWLGSSALHVYYRKAPIKPTVETEDLAVDLNCDEDWIKVIVIGAVAQLVANKDLDQATIDFITEALEAQGFQVGQGADIRNSLLQFQSHLMRPFVQRLGLEHDDRALLTRGY